MGKPNKAIAKYEEIQRQYLEKLQSRLLPGQKLMTCQTCNSIGYYPEWQQVISCIKPGNCQMRIGQHPGEFVNMRMG